MEVMDISAVANPQSGIYVFAGTIEGRAGEYVRMYVDGKCRSQDKHGSATHYVLSLPNSNYAEGIA